MDADRRSESRGLAFDRSQRLGIAAVGALMLAACGLWLMAGRGDPLAATAGAGDGPPYRVNVNTAGWAELSLVPGLGEVLARRIVDYRQAHGPLRSVEELTAVLGIGRIKLREIEPYLVLEEPAAPGGDAGDGR